MEYHGTKVLGDRSRRTGLTRLLSSGTAGRAIRRVLRGLMQMYHHCVFAWLIGLLAWTSAWAEESTRLGIPDRAAQEKALEVIRGIFPEEYASRDPDIRAQLAVKLLQHAGEDQNEPAAAFVLYREAIMIAADVGDLETSMRATDGLVGRFEIAEGAVRAHALQQLAKNIRNTDVRPALVQQCLSTVGMLVGEDDYRRADDLLAAAMTAARGTRDKALIKQVTEARSDVKTAEAHYNKIARFVKALASNPDDPAANLAVGRYQCFLKGNWERGLAQLAKGEDARLKELATDSLAAPTAPAQQYALAGAWWDLAESLTGLEQNQVRSYAGRWYSQAVAQLTGLEKLTADKRLEEIRSSAVASTLRGKRVINLIELIDLEKDRQYGEWSKENGHLVCTSGGLVPRVHIPYQPPEEYDYRVVFSQPKLRNAVALIMPGKDDTFFWHLGGRRGKTGFSVERPDRKNPTSQEFRGAFQPNVKYDTVVQVRRNGVRAFVQGKLVTEYKTDFSDLKNDVWHRMKDKSVISIACDDPTTFYTIELTEISGPGKLTREPTGR